MSFLDRVVNVEQGTDEWKQARVGRVTASRLRDVLAKGKGNAEAATRRDLRMQLVCEILTNTSQEDTYCNADMRWGIDHEGDARGAYQVAENLLVDQVGMVIHPRDSRCAASPDGLVGWDGTHEPEGLIEIKCPRTATHLRYVEEILADIVPTDYQAQMLWQMACTGAKWVDFVSYDPRLPEPLNLAYIRFHRDEARIEEVEREVARFWDEVDCKVATLKKLAGIPEAA